MPCKTVRIQCNSLSVAAVAEELEVPLIGDDVMFTDLSIDSRTLNQGEAFLALKGEQILDHQKHLFCLNFVKKIKILFFGMISI